MDYIPKRLLYGEFPAAGFYGITARQALEAAIDGDLTAYHLISVSVRVQEFLTKSLNPLGPDLGNWHGLTIPVPIGVLYHLNFYEDCCYVDTQGSPTGPVIFGLLGTPEMRPAIDECAAYFLWPNKEALIFERTRLFFLRDDIKNLAEGALPDKQKSGRSTAAGQREIAIEKPSQLLAIAALLELLKRPRSGKSNQEGIKDALLEEFKWRGLSKRSLETIFADANRASRDAAKNVEI